MRNKCVFFEANQFRPPSLFILLSLGEKRKNKSKHFCFTKYTEEGHGMPDVVVVVVDLSLQNDRRCFFSEFRGNPRAVKLFFSLYLVEMETCQTLMTLSE